MKIKIYTFLPSCQPDPGVAILEHLVSSCVVVHSPDAVSFPKLYSSLNKPKLLYIKWFIRNVGLSNTSYSVEIIWGGLSPNF